MRSLPKTAANLSNVKIEGWKTITRVAPYMWPKGQFWVKWRVVVALALLLVSRLVSVATPLVYKWAVDSFGDTPSTPAFMLEIGRASCRERVLMPV